MQCNLDLHVCTVPTLFSGLWVGSAVKMQQRKMHGMQGAGCKQHLLLAAQLKAVNMWVYQYLPAWCCWKTANTRGWILRTAWCEIKIYKHEQVLCPDIAFLCLAGIFWTWVFCVALLLRQNWFKMMSNKQKQTKKDIWLYSMEGRWDEEHGEAGEAFFLKSCYAM